MNKKTVRRKLLNALIGIFIIPPLIFPTTTIFAEEITSIENDTTTESALITNNILTQENNYFITENIMDEAVQSAENNLISEEENAQTTQFQNLTYNSQNPSIPAEFTKSVKPTVDQTTGGLVYDYPITTPPGRNNVQPDLKLTYNSNNKENISAFGYGWNINIPYIERINKTGTDKLYSEEYFNSSLYGELTKTGNNTFSPKVQSGFYSTFSFTNDTWTFFDQNGVKYIYGSSTSSRQDDPNDATHIFKWMLEKVEDSNGNSMTYEYDKDTGQIYPGKIFYTNDSTTGIFEIDFSRTQASDAYIGYATGFKVATNYYISNISTQINGTIANKYNLNYTQSDIKTRFLLTSIQRDYLKNNSFISYPATKFQYQKESAKGFDGTATNYKTGILPIDIMKGVGTADVNGDSYPDFIKAYEWVTLQYRSEKGVYTYRSQNKNWEEDTDWKIPNDIMLFTDDMWNPHDGGTRILDVNGDMKPDLLRNNSTISNDPVVQKINNGTGWSDTNSWNKTMSGYSIADINGDGLPEYIKDTMNWNGNFNTFISFNTGTTFDAYSTSQHPPQSSSSNLFESTEFLDRQVIIDVNADGLADIVTSTLQYTTVSPYNIYTQKVYINTGFGWSHDSSWSIPNDFNIFIINTFGNREMTRFYFTDVNNDGFNDVITSGNNQGGGAGVSVYINNGHGWVFDKDWNNSYPIIDIQNCNCQNPVLIDDFDANGSPDGVNVGKNSNGTITANFSYNKNSNRVGLLSKITLPTGGSIIPAYKTSSHYEDGNGNLSNPTLPIIMQTVESITTDDGLGNTQTTHYTYEGGSYYYNTSKDRMFAGFNLATQKNPDGTIIKTFYHQGNATDSSNGEYDDKRSKIGKIYKTETYNSGGGLVKRDFTKWNSYAISSDIDFAYKENTLSQIFDINGGSYNTAVGYNYDFSNGVNTATIEYGEVVAAIDGFFTDYLDDKRITDYYYSKGNNGSLFIREEILTDNTGNQLSVTKKYYDNRQFGTATLGNITKESKWISNNMYADTMYTYNSFGMITTITEPKGNVTKYIYDSYNLYPEKIINTLNQNTTYTYDYNLGTQLSVTDPNGATFHTNYDGMGRQLSIVGPDTTSNNQVTYSENFYIDIPINGTTVPYKMTTIYQNSTQPGNTYEMYDGLGRTIRTVQETAIASFVSTDTTYDSMGRIAKISLPYISNGSLLYTGIIAPSGLIKTISYDAIGRPLLETTILGTTSYIYTNNKTIITNPEGKITDVYRDAFGNIIRVGKHIGATIDSTEYEWNLQGDLIGMKDPEGNIRTVTYDSLGRRTSITDLHSVTDTTYGIYSYEYDKNNNLTKQITPRGHIITYNYDPLNRLLSESLAGVLQKTYTYDTGCVNGIGNLCVGEITGGAKTEYGYAKNGTKNIESITYNTKTFTTTTITTLTKKPMEITHPNGIIVKYTYDLAGRISAIDYKTPLTPTLNTIATLTLGAHSLPENIFHSNNVNDTYVYDETNYYTLKNMSVGVNGNTPILSELYLWNPNKNLTQKIDNTDPDNVNTYLYTYDDLDRLLVVLEKMPNSLPVPQIYNYNSIGNITSGPSGTYSYNGTQINNYDNPHAVQSIGGKNMLYDKNGNTTKIDTAVLTWNYRDELTKYVDNSLQVNMSMLYDYAGNRIRTIDSNSTTYTPSKTYEEKGTKKTVYIYAGDTLIATAITDNNITQINHIHSDYLGSNRLTTDSSGTVIDSTTYYPYGTIATSTTAPSYSDPHKYTGTRYDKDTDLNFMQARYQSGSQARFLSQDSVFKAFGDVKGMESISNQKFEVMLLNPNALNSYSYANNNPIKNIDPDGNLSREALLSNPIKSIQHVVAWNLFSLTGNVINRPLSAALLRHSASFEPGNITINSNNQNQFGNPIDKITATSQYKSFVNQAIENAKNGQEVTPGSFRFDKGDLYTAMYKVNIQISVENTKDAWILNTNISDVYDFNPVNPQTYKGAITRLPAAQAHKDQGSGVISNYSVNIQFSDKINK